MLNSEDVRIVVEFTKRKLADLNPGEPDEADKVFECLKRLTIELNKNEPLELLIFCPVCKTQHVDVGKFATEPHKRHSCQNCGLLFSVTRDEPNIGVKFFRGCRDGDHHVTLSPDPSSQPYISPGVIPTGMELTARVGDQVMVFKGSRW